MATITDLTEFRLRQLPPEPWGGRLARARDDAGHTLRSIADLLDGQHNLSRGTISRLEALTAEPTHKRDRRRAFILLVIYGIDPLEFGLGPDDIPTVVDLDALHRLGNGWIGWFSGSPEPALLVA